VVIEHWLVHGSGHALVRRQPGRALIPIRMAPTPPEKCGDSFCKTKNPLSRTGHDC
jgi:hypothetical protein